MKRLTLMAHDVAELGGPLAPFWSAFSHATIRALRERRSTLAHLEQSILDEDAALGAIVEPGSDPVGDAQRELRAALRLAAEGRAL